MGVSNAELQAPHTARVLFLVTLVFVILVVGTILWKLASTVVTELQSHGYIVPISVTGAQRYWYGVVTVIIAAAAATIVFLAVDLIRREE